MKRQSRKVGVAGGFFNQLMGNNSTEPKVGEGATILHYSDRDAYEVIEVSEDGNSCVIRAMDTEWCGTAYGDEQYTFTSNEDNGTIELEWNETKGAWGSVRYQVQVIKALYKKLSKEYGYDWYLHLPNGVDYDSLFTEEARNATFPLLADLKLVEGVTKRYKIWDKKSVIFGVMEQYRDPSF